MRTEDSEVADVLVCLLTDPDRCAMCGVRILLGEYEIAMLLIQHFPAPVGIEVTNNVHLYCVKGVTEH
jgi:hypothetical protein